MHRGQDSGLRTQESGFRIQKSGVMEYWGIWVIGYLGNEVMGNQESVLS